MSRNTGEKNARDVAGVPNPARRDLRAMLLMTRRGLKIFLKDRASVFFSLLAPLIILLLYVLFLGDVQISSMESAFAGSGLARGDIRAFVDGWMIAGVMSVACITVSYSANSVMVQDRARGVLNDSLASPVRRQAITASYFLYNYAVTVVICMLVLAVCIAYLCVSGGFFLTAAEVCAAVGITLLSALSATMITVFVAGFLKTESALSASGGILSAVIGFVIGAYMPISMFPLAVQRLILCVPGTYSAGLYRNCFMRGALDNLALPPEAAAELETAYSMRLEFFGLSVPLGAMAVVLAGSAALFLALSMVFSFRRQKGGK